MKKLSTFCFLCGRLGYRESFCPIRMIKGSGELPFSWYLSLKALVRRSVVGGSIWLRELGGNWGSDYGISREKSRFSNQQSNSADFLFQASCNLGSKLAGKSTISKKGESSKITSDDEMASEEQPIPFLDGKKRPRINVEEDGPSGQDPNLLVDLQGIDMGNSQTAEPIMRVSWTL